MDAFDRYKAFQFYYLAPRVVDDDEYRHLRCELDWVMSGKHNEDLSKELLADGGRKGGTKKRRKAHSCLSSKKQKEQRKKHYEQEAKRQNKSAK